MSKEKQKLSPDIVLKNYRNNNEQFADLFNGALFDGEQIIKADELVDVDTEESTILENKKYAESIKASRDNIKIRKRSTVYGVELILLGLDIPEQMTKYVNDYKMLLVEAKENNLALHNINNRDLFSLLEILLDTELSKHEAKEKAIQYCEEHNTEKTVIMTVAGATNTKLDYNSFAKGDGRMCTVFDEIARESEAVGEVRDRAFGIIETGLEFGLSESDILSRLQKKLDVSLQVAQEYLAMFGKQTV